jgi:hypothetical protein
MQSRTKYTIGRRHCSESDVLGPSLEFVVVPLVVPAVAGIALNQFAMIRLPGVDVLHLRGAEVIHKMTSGDTLFICNGMAQLDTERDVDVTVSGAVFRFVYPDSDIIIVNDRRLASLRRGAQRLVANPAMPGAICALRLLDRAFVGDMN